ncbi:hypothetical protein HYW40_01355, partial [Candidatus Curtissbacteria bacterium]|nr:hypothetical protein [Candidatus Curtissbacteria bacterium]
GLYRLRTTDHRLQKEEAVDGRQSTVVYFLPSCEISSIYSQGGKGRRIHTLFMFPKLESVDKFNKELIKRRANLRSDGRPIVGIPSRDLAKIALDCDEKALVIPAHAWTPWFSIFGSFSGFDSIEECFGDMAPYIYGIETGLSSDPAMNWQISDLENRSILSFSDAHSLEKMGREATVFEGNEVSYDCIYNAIKGYHGEKEYHEYHGNDEDKKARGTRDTLTTRDTSKLSFTIEFYPEEGKYHFTGHRNCSYSQGPEVDRNRPCPVCGRGLTVGVMDRVGELKNRQSLSTNQNEKFPDGNPKIKIEEIDGVKWSKSSDNRPPYVSLVPLGEILAEALSVGAGTQRVRDVYMALVTNLGSEFGVLMRASAGDIARVAGGRVAEAVAKVRHGDIVVEPGYDGQFGVVKIWPGAKEDKVENAKSPEDQLNLFV